MRRSAALLPGLTTGCPQRTEKRRGHQPAVRHRDTLHGASPSARIAFQAVTEEEGENMASDALQDGQHLVRSLGTTGESVAVWGADHMWAASGWSLLTVDVGMKGGTPLGSLTYIATANNRTTDVAVRWDHVHDQLQCFVIDRGTARTEREVIERDARARIGALLRISAEVGWRFASSEISRADIFEAAGLSTVAVQSPPVEPPAVCNGDG